MIKIAAYLVLFSLASFTGCGVKKSERIQLDSQSPSEKKTIIEETSSELKCGKMTPVNAFRSHSNINFELKLDDKLKCTRMKLLYQFDNQKKCKLSSSDWIEEEMTCVGRHCSFTIGPNSLYEVGKTPIPLCKVDDVQLLCFYILGFSEQDEIVCSQLDSDGAPFISICDDAIETTSSTESFDSCSVLNDLLIVPVPSH